MADATAAVDAAAALRSRFQALVLRQVTAIYSVLRGHIADHIAEIALCRKRLAGLAAILETRQPAEPSAATLLLPPGCDSVLDAARDVIAGIELVAELDRRVQQDLADSAGGLTRACLGGGDLSETLGPVLLTAAEMLLAPHVTDRAAEIFVGRYPDSVAALIAMHDNAAPTLTGNADTTTVFAPPALAHAARQAFGPNVSFTSTNDEIAVVRTACLPLTSLPQCGAAAKAAYQRRKAAGDSAHSRADMIFGVD
jgi:hypothetical protein